MPAVPHLSRHARTRPANRPVTAMLVACLTLLLGAAVTPLVAQGSPMTLKAAYDAGLIMISVEIAAQDKRGDRLQLAIEPMDKPLTITLSTDTTSLAVAKPFDSLVFRATAPQTLPLASGNPAKLVVNQVGELRFVAGKFQIAMDGGEPQFVGSATVDIVK